MKPYARTAVRQAVQAMTEQGTLLPVTVEGLSEVYFVQPDHLEQTSHRAVGLGVNGHASAPSVSL